MTEIVNVDLAYPRRILNKGELTLEGRYASDLDVVNSARVSFHSRVNDMTEKDEGLINFLMKNHHGTPFEHNFFKFRVKAPLFVFREWHRHRVGHSYNEWSARYSQLKPEFYVPDQVRTQVGKPGNYTYEEVEDDVATDFRATLIASSEAAYAEYEAALSLGIAKEQARLFLPVNIYSEMIWSVNARSMMHFLGLRNSLTAQYEIRAYAAEVERIFEQVMPITARCFIENGRIAP